MNNFGFLSVVPIIIVIVLAVLTKRTMASLIIGSIIASIIAYGTGFFGPWVDALYAGLADGVWGWMALVCGLFGSLVGLFTASNCVSSFSDIAYKFANTRRKSLIATFILGVIVFVDEWLSVLVVGHAMKEVTDKHRIPRELLAYVITATGAVVCVLLPFSTWSAFHAGQFEANGIAESGQGLTAYINTIPYMFWPLFALVISLLIVTGVIPVWGPMRKAVLRAEKEGVLLPGGDPSADIVEQEMAAATQEENNNKKQKTSALNFIIPLIVLAAITMMTAEMLYGVMGAIIVCAIMYFVQRILTFSEFCTAMLDGFKDMLGVIGIVYAAFVLRTLNETLGLADYVIGAVRGNISTELLPAAVFVVMCALIYAAGNFWGMAAISFPVVIPIGLAADANMTLIASAVVCATSFGATACFYGSEVALTCSATKVSNIDYAKTSLPIIAIPTVLSVIAFAIAGYIV